MKTLSWERHVPLATNPFILWDLLRVAAFVAVLVWAVPAAMGLLIDGEVVLIPLELLAALMVGFFLLAVLVMGILLRNDYHVVYTLDERRACCQGHLETGFLFRVLSALSLLLSGRFLSLFRLLASWGEGYEELPSSSCMAWTEVGRVTLHRRARVITLSSSWFHFLRLYCPRDAFDEIAAYVEGRVLETERRKAVAPRRRRSRPARLRFLLAWALASGAATRASQMWETDVVAIPAAVAGTLVLVAGLADGSHRRKLSVAATCASAANLAFLVYRLSEEWQTGGMATIGSEPGVTLVASVAGGIGLLAMGIIRILAPPATPWAR